MKKNQFFSSKLRSYTKDGSPWKSEKRSRKWQTREICQFPCNFYSKFSFQLLKKVRFDANVITQLIVHVTPFVWRKMNFQLTFFK